MRFLIVFMRQAFMNPRDFNLPAFICEGNLYKLRY